MKMMTTVIAIRDILTILLDRHTTKSGIFAKIHQHPMKMASVLCAVTRIAMVSSDDGRRYFTVTLHSRIHDSPVEELISHKNTRMQFTLGISLDISHFDPHTDCLCELIPQFS